MCTFEREPPGWPALAVVQRQVDRLVDDLLDQLPVVEAGGRAFVELVEQVGSGGGHLAGIEPASTSSPVLFRRASDSPMRSMARLRFSRLLA